jgi:predicted lipid-binding transport protein (Tim44 family)
VRPSGIIGGLLSGIGALLLLQQFGTVYVTRTALIIGVVGGLVAGIVVPSLLAATRRDRSASVAAPAAVEPAPAAVEPAPARDADVVPEPAGEAGWTPTHVAPADGLHAYAEPDPGAELAGWVEPGVELEVGERRGEWVLVRRADGWSGWADARLVQPRVP